MRIGQHRTKESAVDVEVVTRNYMLYFLLPLWIIPGLMDWWCHRRTRIKATSGTTESLIHLLMMAEIAIPITMGLLLEINALAISIMIAAFFVHEATAFWDVAYAERIVRSRRPSSISTASWRCCHSWRYRS